MGGWSTGNGAVPVKADADSSPDRLRGATHDLFELLERVQCSRLDDQRCVLPAYFSTKVSWYSLMSKMQTNISKRWAMLLNAESDHWSAPQITELELHKS